jgi:hypothetical protein
MSQILSVAPQRVNNSIDTDLLYGYSESLLIISDSAKQLIEEPILAETEDSTKGIQKTTRFLLLGFLAIIIIGIIVFIQAKRKNAAS